MSIIACACKRSWYPETTNYIYLEKLPTHMAVDYTDFDE